MWRRSSLCATALFFGVLLAGCVAEDEGSPAGSSERFDGDPDAATIEGIVVDDEGYPVEGAGVGIIQLDRETTTDAQGAFVFRDVPPGRYAIAAVRLGAESTVQSVEVAAGSVVRVTITMAALVVQEVYHATHGPLVGFLECGFGTPFWTDTCISTDFFGNLSGGRHRTYFHMDDGNWQSFVLDAWWQQTSAATGRGMEAFFRYDESAANHWWCSRDGTSPLLFRFEHPDNGQDSDCGGQGAQDPLPDPEMTLTVEGYPGFAGLSADDPPARATFQQEFEVLATVFYGEPGPQGFTAHPDA